MKRPKLISWLKTHRLSVVAGLLIVAIASGFLMAAADCAC